jgi:hypothetical protein
MAELIAAGIVRLCRSATWIIPVAGQDEADCLALLAARIAPADRDALSNKCVV